MDSKDSQLVETVTQQVLAALAAQGMLSLEQGCVMTCPPSNSETANEFVNAIGHSVASSLPSVASINPPIGQCTGDYSKFPELEGKLYNTAANSSLASTAPTLPPAPASQPAPLTGIITANQLQQALDAAAINNAADQGKVFLVNDARLTPLANDLARQLAQNNDNRIERLTPGQPTAITPATATLPWLWWIEGQCPVVREVTRGLTNWIRPIAAAPSASSLARVTNELASSIRSKQCAGGIIFVPNASRATCYLNRCASIRAVVGTCGQAVEQGITDIGANVLVIEYPHHGKQSMNAMIQRMLQQQPYAPPAIERDLADLHRC